MTSDQDYLTTKPFRLDTVKFYSRGGRPGICNEEASHVEAAMNSVISSLLIAATRREDAAQGSAAKSGVSGSTGSG
jgi:hypothetical protein